jgi:hypothetical protein
MPKTGNYAMDYGPYYRPAVTSTQAQKEAIGLPPLSPSELAGISYGELSSRYAEDRANRNEGRRADLAERTMKITEDRAEAEVKANKVRGVATAATLAGTLGTSIGTAMTSAGVGLSLGGGMALTGAAMGPIGLVLGGIAGITMAGKD